MARHYTVPTGTDAEQTVRKFYVDGAGDPAPGETVTFIVRDVGGNDILSGTLVDLAIAPGWYKLPSALVLDTPGIYTVEYSPPAAFTADADTIFVSTEDGRATTEFVKGG
jgi:hypothetical protein